MSIRLGEWQRLRQGDRYRKGKITLVTIVRGGGGGEGREFIGNGDDVRGR